MPDSAEGEFFVRFLEGYWAAAQLLNRAARGGYLIEYICLAASLVDALLRVGLTLRHQLDSRSCAIPRHLVFQGDSDEPMSERSVYSSACAAGIIDKKLHSDLNRLYTQRNKVVHRYIISDIKTDEMNQIAEDYDSAIRRVSAAVALLEEEQIRSGSGMTKAGSPESREQTVAHMKQMASGKHGAQWLVDHLAESP